MQLTLVVAGIDDPGAGIAAAGYSIAIVYKSFWMNFGLA
jgi:hypothetical protein